MADAAEQQREQSPAGEAAAELREGTSSAAASEGSGEGDLSGLGGSADEGDSKGSEAMGGGDPKDGADRPSKGAALSHAAASSSGPATGASAAKAAPLTMKAKIALLKEEQRALRASNKAKTREIRNTERRSKRLKAKVGGLTDEDLNEVLRARAEAKALGAAKAKVSPTGTGSAGQSRSPALKRALTAQEMGGAGYTPGLRAREPTPPGPDSGLPAVMDSRSRLTDRLGLPDP